MTYDRPEYRDLLRDVLTSPDDDFPRLRLADWLEEQGDVPRAEFIRLQVWCAAHPILPDSTTEHLEEYRRTFRRVRDLLWAEGNATRWFGEVIGKTTHFCRDEYAWDQEYPARTGALAVLVQRGFVHALTCSWADWVQHCDELLACQPVREVTLTDAVRWSNTTIVRDTGAIEERPVLYARIPPDPTSTRYVCRRARRSDAVSTDPIRGILRAEWDGIKFHMPEE